MFFKLPGLLECLSEAPCLFVGFFFVSQSLLGFLVVFSRHGTSASFLMRRSPSIVVLGKTRSLDDVRVMLEFLMRS